MTTTPYVEHQRIEVTITVKIGDEVKEFTSDAVTTGDPHDIARGVIDGLTTSAKNWIWDQKAKQPRWSR